ncbi:MAG: hypothetical protein K2X82_23525 [Gemmataceae bacterium]|nr:hypothetical protein [Gemmataceae bacterium]
MTPTDPVPPAPRLTATEIRRLPREHQDALLEAAAALAEDDYRNDPDLTAFEAFGDGDLFDEHALADWNRPEEDAAWGYLQNEEAAPGECQAGPASPEPSPQDR